MPTRDRNTLDHLEEEIPHLQRYARSLTHDAERADDLVQDCLEKAIDHEDQFKTGTNLRRWLFTILKNRFIDKQRARTRRGVQVPIEEWSSAAAHRPEQLDKLEIQSVFEAMDDLRREERDVIDIVVFRGKQYREASQELDVAVGTVKSRLARARQSLAALTGHAA